MVELQRLFSDDRFDIHLSVILLDVYSKINMIKNLLPVCYLKKVMFDK